MAIVDLLTWITSALFSLFFLAGSITSFLERERRAGILLFIASGIIGLYLILIAFILPVNTPVKTVILTVEALLLAAFFLPVRGTKKYRYEVPNGRFHEADAVLSRRKLKPGSAEYNAYYERHPEFKLPDDRARDKPGLLSEESKFYNPGTFNAARANFVITDHLHALSGLKPGEKKTGVDGAKMKRFIERWMRRSGAHSVGFTSLKDYHLYSHKGRGAESGKAILNDLPHAIAITVEMSYEMMKPAPAGTTVMESSEQYLNSGMHASKLATYIKSLGYNARAHIDGMYEVICPLVAADAGLGVIGRMGLLMTPKLGPRVRIAVVTTDIPLEYPQDIAHDMTPVDFCDRCNKCAVACPADAIPGHKLKETDGVRRWRIDSEKCYHFWTISGTDCGRCIRSCPYAHPDNWFHRFIRWSIKNNLVFRGIAVKLDNIFYGRRPEIKPLPNWANIN